MTARRKSMAQTAPATRAEAEALLIRYADLSAMIAARSAAADAAIAGIRRDCADLNAPLEIELRDIFARLRAWWAVAAAEVAPGRRSAEIAGAEIGVRRTPPALRIAGDALAVLARLRDTAMHLVRVKTEIDRPACIDALRDPAQAKYLAELGLSAVQKEEFFIAIRPLESVEIAPAS